MPNNTKNQRWSRGHKAQGQGRKKNPDQGQGQPLRGHTVLKPMAGMLEVKDQDASASVLQEKNVFKIFFQAVSKKKKRSSKNFFMRSPMEENKKGLHKFSARFLVFSNEISSVQEIVLSSSRGQGNFRGLEDSSPRPRTWPSRPRTSSRTPPLLKILVYHEKANTSENTRASIAKNLFCDKKERV